MSGPGGLNRPGAPDIPGAWDERSGETHVAETDDTGRDGQPTAGRKQTPARRTAVDPVKALMHRHRELCERAVDPLEIAAGLEAHGLSDRTAARFRHRDVFSLAEEMYARVPRDSAPPPRPTAPEAPRPRAAWAVLTLLPGTLCAATVTALRLTHGQPRLISATVGALAVALSLRVAVRRDPLNSASRRGPSRTAYRTSLGTATWTCWLVGYALLGDGLLRAALTGGPDSLPTPAPDAPWPLTAAPVLALALSYAPAAWTAHLFAAAAGRKLATSRGLDDFATSVRPLLLGTFALYLCALTALLTLSARALDEPAPYAETLTLGALLYLALLLTTHGFTNAPPLVLTTTALVQATALATLFASRLPGCTFLATPVETLTAAWDPTAIPTLTCGAASLTLLIHAARRLTKASAHTRSDQSC
jgi:hypothetical protein